MDIAVDIMPAFPVFFQDFAETDRLREYHLKVGLNQVHNLAFYLISKSCKHNANIITRAFVGKIPLHM